MDKQYTIRNINPELDAKIRAKAHRDRVPLNAAVLEILTHGLKNSEVRGQRHHDFDDLADSWQNDPAFDAAMNDLRKIDERDWE